MKILLKHSFAGRVCLYIIPVIIAIFCIVTIWFYQVSRKKSISSSIKETNIALANMSLKIEEQLQSVSHSLDYTAWGVASELNNPEKVKAIMRHNVKINPMIIGCGVAYEPTTSNGKEKLNMIYASKRGSDIQFKNLGSNQYYYPGMDWYIIPKLLKHGYWSEPYYDEGGGDIAMTTYSVPLFDSKGKVCGIMGVDISLLGFTEMVKKLKPFPDSYTFMLSRNGYYLTHEKKERILRESIFSYAASHHSKDIEETGRAMIAGKSGYRTNNENGDITYAVYTSIPSNGWSICNVSRQDIMLTGLNDMTRMVTIIFIVGILCFLVFTILVIKRLMKPLEGFASSAQEIAHGNFDAKLPNIKSNDEMKELHDSFDYMQHSLTTYIAELKETTASKQRIESELNIAHKIQMGMIPKLFPAFPEREDLDLYAFLKPAKEVGGDLYDFFIADEKLFFAVGDVSGKGVPASLFMAVTRSLFRNISRYAPTAKDIVTSMNDSIAEQNETNMFVTLFVGILDLKSGCLTYCNAGHNPPILIAPEKDVTYMQPKKVQPVVGIFPNMVYENEEIVFAKGTKLFCYTDGVVEAENKEKQLYSENKLLEAIGEYRESGVKLMTDQVLDSIAQHVLTAEQSDDLTILVINYKK